MSITDALRGIKGKVLDSVHYELLKNAYDLQEENIKQLQTNNKLLQEKLTGLERENKALKEDVSLLRQKVDKFEADAQITEFSEEACSILKVYSDSDETRLRVQEIARVTSFSNITLDAAFSELTDAGLITMPPDCLLLPDTEPSYELTKKGSKYLANKKA